MSLFIDTVVSFFALYISYKLPVKAVVFSMLLMTICWIRFFERYGGDKNA